MSLSMILSMSLSMKNTKLLSTFCFVSLAAASLCGLNSAQAYELSARQERVLVEAAANGKFWVHFVDLNVCHTPQTVVVFGETHFKTRNSARLGEKVLSEFQLRGLEGATAADINPLIASVLVPATKALQVVAPLVGFHGSTIHDARNIGFFYRPDGTVSYNGVLVGNMVAGAPSPKGPSQDSITQAVAKIRKNLDGADSHLVMLKEWQGTMFNSNSAINIGIEYGAIEGWSSKATASNVEGSDMPLISARNRRFASNIIQVLCNFPEQKTLLVIVGDAHSEGLSNILAEQAESAFDMGAKK